MKLLSLMCNGKAITSRHLMREQELNAHHISILDSLAHYMEVLSVSMVFLRKLMDQARKRRSKTVAPDVISVF